MEQLATPSGPVRTSTEVAPVPCKVPPPNPVTNRTLAPATGRWPLATATCNGCGTGRPAAASWPSPPTSKRLVSSVSAGKRGRQS